MPFYNRERDVSRMLAVLSGEPNLVYFVYGPINSGKTALLNRVFEELDDSYRVFYINFRGVETRKYEDFVRAMFQPKDEGLFRRFLKKLDIVDVAIEYAKEVSGKVNFHFEVPSRLLRLFFNGDERERDCFRYLEELMRSLSEKGYRPVLVLDEIQMLKEVKRNGPVLHDLFNFLVRMTKETHLCHCLCATSDCLFIEHIYASARLEGRADYILVDDLDKDEAYVLYEHFGFEDRELVWDYIGGKVGDMVRLYERKKRGEAEKQALEELKAHEVGKLKELLTVLGYVEGSVTVMGRSIKIDKKRVVETLTLFIDSDTLEKEALSYPGLLFLVSENILFYNPLTGTVKPQGRLIWQAIREVV